MAREKFCPKCGEDITDSYEDDITKTKIVDGVAVMRGDWYCEACELPVEEEDHDD